jgi:hypothetical protein
MMANIMKQTLMFIIASSFDQLAIGESREIYCMVTSIYVVEFRGGTLDGRNRSEAISCGLTESDCMKVLS